MVLDSLQSLCLRTLHFQREGGGLGNRMNRMYRHARRLCGGGIESMSYRLVEGCEVNIIHDFVSISRCRCVAARLRKQINPIKVKTGLFCIRFSLPLSV